jgi:glycosyltransferase involved in cell wall biosynthesis
VSRPLILVTGSPKSTRALHEAEAPQLDYVEMARQLDAEVSYPRDTPGLVEKLERRTVSVNVGQAWRARGRRPSLFLSLSEQCGVPMAWVRPPAPHVLVAHNLTSRRRQAFQRWTRFLGGVDRVIVLSPAQRRYLVEEVGIRSEKVDFLYGKVDHRFFRPGDDPDGEFVFSVGSEQRDYATLIEAVRPLDVPVVIVPSSVWVRRSAVEDNLPANVDMQADLTFAALRRLYERASVVVVSVRPGVRYAAGVNGVLEGMAMGKPVVVSRTPGLEGYVDDGETGRWVPPADPGALRQTLLELLGDPAERRRLALNGRRVIDSGRNLETYVSSVVAICRSFLDSA